MAQEIKYAYLGDLTAKRGEDGFLRVKGLATDATLDLDEQICDPDWLKSAMPAWMEIGNIREMHQSKAVGKALEMEQSGTGFIVEAKIVDPIAAKMVEEGIYTGFSVGIKGARVIKDAAAPGGRIISGKIVEVSLVDRPANPSAVIEIAKSIDGELVKGAAVSETETEKFASTGEINNDAVMSEVPVNPEINEPRADAFQPCPACGGSGHKSNIDAEALTEIRCEECDGSGRAPEGIHENIQQASPTSDKENNENHEIKASDPDATAEAEPELEKREFTDAERQDAADAGQALPDGSYPIKTVGDLKNAIQAFGRAKDKVKVKAHIIARAKALGKENLIPEDWAKAIDADLAKADEMKHDPAELNAVRQSLINLIKAELDEMAAGNEDETCDVSELLYALSLFLTWWDGEADENETSEPFATTEKEDTMAYIGLGVSADLIKAASADEATADQKNALRDEIRKALGVDDVIATYKAALAEQEERIETLKSALDEVREMAAPGGPVLRATQVQTQKSAQVEALKIEAEGLRLKAANYTNPDLRNQYLEAARALEAKIPQF